MRIITPRTAPPARRAPTSEAAAVSPLVRGALDAAFGVREAATLTSKLYALGVRNHINARRRLAAAATAHGPVRIVSCHAREGGEFFGTVDAGGRRFGYAARVRDGALVSFKVL
ncbi:hypothetical protein C3E79_02785 [Corynebacterium liangguodongii]|uniref:Uncharacterized protein n=2 Tax=Corynebacterium liangguodongii TaxID=2079535 RepID=A0A2S0WGV1_9CORY|nr:hypothetical protein C3E79_02785 [Corynebacterium liangguodongii]PWC00676.1 hypothetical protein DF219_00170 [Corynebacterium liangguodongii]